MRRGALLLLVISCAMGLLYCKQRANQNKATSAVRADQTTIGQGALDCTEMCKNTTDNRKWAVCYSCRCKAAFGNFMPPPSDLDCQGGEDAKKFQFKQNPDRLELIQSQVNQCINPERLYYDCNPGHRVVTRVYKDGKKLEPNDPEYRNGDLVFRKLCKRERFIPNFNDQDMVYDETAVIGYNVTSGATCFWDDNDRVVNGRNQPDLDLTTQDPVVREKKIDDYFKAHYRGEGDMCVSCHDNDAFMFDTSYLSTNWYTNSRITKGLYYMVQSNGTKKRIGRHLGPKKNEQGEEDNDTATCMSCHRITGQIMANDSDTPKASMTCERWLADSIGEQNNKPTKQALMVRSPNGPFGHIVHDNRKWSYPYWMPDYNFMRKNSEPPATAQEWDEEFGASVRYIKNCCANPSDASCNWKWVPAE